MGKYFYRAIKDKKELVTGHVDADNLAEAKEQVRLMGFTPAGIYEEHAVPKQYKSSTEISVKSLKLSELKYFTSELQMLTSSGISILESLSSIKEHAPSLRIGLFARDLERVIKSGKSFYEALMPYEDILGNVYVTLCRTGEESGALPETLDYLLNLLKKKESLRSKLIHMSVYPAILIVVLVIEFMLFGLGIFPTMIENLQIDQVPPIAMAFIAGASFVLKLWWLFVFTAIGGWLLLKFTIGFKAIKKSVGNFFAKIPLMKDCLKYFSLSHYMSVLYVAYEAGVPIVAALRMAEDTISVAKINEQAKSVTNHVGKGESITDAFYKSDMLPPVIMSMVSTGEKTGKLGQMFRDISIAVEQKLDAAISVMSRAFEPLLLLVVGAGVAVMAVAVIQMYISSLTSMF